MGAQRVTGQGEMKIQKQLKTKFEQRRRKPNPDIHRQAHRCQRSPKSTSTVLITSPTDNGANTV